MRNIFAKILVTSAIALIMCSCCSRRIVSGRQSVDSVTVVRQTEYIEKLRDTTIYITLPAEVRQVVKRDSSRLETSTALSLARIEPDGALYHTLESKPIPIPVDMQIKETHNDASQKEIIIQKELVEVEVQRSLTRWQRFCINSGIVGWILLIVWSGFTLRRKLRGR